MKVDITPENITITPAIDQYLELRLSAIGKYIDADDESAKADVYLVKTTEHHKQGKIFKAKINLHVSGWSGQAEAVDENLYNAINEMKSEIIRQLKTHRKKNQTKERREGMKIKKMLRGWWSE